MNYENQNIDELVRTAEHENNTLALCIADLETDDNLDLIDDMIYDTAQHFASEIDDKLTAYIDDYYLNGESDYFEFLFEMPIEKDAIETAMKNGDLETELTVDQIMDKLDCMLDYYCEVEISRNYSASRGISVAGGIIGEMEESIEMVTDDIPDLYSDSVSQEKLGKAIMEKISAVHVPDDAQYIYIDLSSDYCSLVLKADTLKELLATED